MPKISSQKRDARCQQILDAAGRCFAREGFHCTSMEDIVRESGLSPGAIYCYFRGKNEIVAAIAAQRHRQETALLAKLLGPGSISARLRQLTRDFLNLLQEPGERQMRKVTIQIWAESLRDKEIRKIVGRGLRQRQALTASLLTAQRNRELRSDLDPDSLSRVMLAMLQGFILQQAWEPQLNSAKFFEIASCLISSALTDYHDGFSNSTHTTFKRPGGRRSKGLGTTTRSRAAWVGPQGESDRFTARSGGDDGNQ